MRGDVLNTEIKTQDQDRKRTRTRGRRNKRASHAPLAFCSIARRASTEPGEGSTNGYAETEELVDYMYVHPR